MSVVGPIVVLFVVFLCSGGCCLTINVCGRVHPGHVCGFLVFRRLVPINVWGRAHRGHECGFLVFRRLAPDRQCLWSSPSWSCLWFPRVQEVGAWLWMPVVGPIVVMFVVFLCSGGWLLTINVCDQAHRGHVCGFLVIRRLAVEYKCLWSGLFVVFCVQKVGARQTILWSGSSWPCLLFSVFRRLLPDFQCLWSGPSWSCLWFSCVQEVGAWLSMSVVVPILVIFVVFSCSGGWCLTINVCGRAHRGPVCGFLVFRRLVPDIQSCGWAHCGPVCGFLVFRRLMPDYQCLWSCPSWSCLWSCLWFCRVQEVGAWLSMSVVVPILVMFVVFYCSGCWCLTINVCGRAHRGHVCGFLCSGGCCLTSSACGRAQHGHVCGFLVFRRMAPDYKCLWSCPSWSCLWFSRVQEVGAWLSVSVVLPIRRLVPDYQCLWSCPSWSCLWFSRVQEVGAHQEVGAWLSMSVVVPFLVMFVVFSCSGGWCLTINVCGRAHRGHVCGFLCSGGCCLTSNVCGQAHRGHVCGFLCTGGCCLTSNACGHSHACGFLVFRRLVPDYQCLWSCPSWSCLWISHVQKVGAWLSMSVVGPILVLFVVFLCSGGWCLTYNPVVGLIVALFVVFSCSGGWCLTINVGPIVVMFVVFLWSGGCLWSGPLWSCSCLWFSRVQEVAAWRPLPMVGPIVVMFVVFLCSGGWCLTINVCGHAHPGPVCGFLVFRRLVPDYQCLWSCPSWSCLWFSRVQEVGAWLSVSVIGSIVVLFVVFYVQEVGAWLSMSVVGPIMVMFVVFCVQEVAAWLPMPVVRPIVVMFVVFLCSGGWHLTINVRGHAHPGHVCGFLCSGGWCLTSNAIGRAHRGHVCGFLVFRRLAPDYQCLWLGSSWPCLWLSHVQVDAWLSMSVVVPILVMFVVFSCSGGWCLTINVCGQAYPGHVCGFLMFRRLMPDYQCLWSCPSWSCLWFSHVQEVGAWLSVSVVGPIVALFVVFCVQEVGAWHTILWLGSSWPCLWFSVFRRLLPDFQCLWSGPSWSCLWFSRVQEFGAWLPVPVVGPIVVMFVVFCVQDVGAWLPMPVVGPIVALFVVFSCSGGWCLTSNACGRAHRGPVCNFFCVQEFGAWLPMPVVGPIVALFVVFCVQEVGAWLPMSVVGPIVALFVVFLCSGGWCLISNACSRTHRGPVCGFLVFRRLVPDFQCQGLGARGMFVVFLCSSTRQSLCPLLCFIIEFVIMCVFAGTS